VAARSTPDKSAGERPAPKGALSETATPKETVPKRRKVSAKGQPTSETKRAPRSKKRAQFNAETAAVLRDAEAGKNLLQYPSVEAMFEDLGI
jgi:hypothetical protein